MSAVLLILKIFAGIALLGMYTTWPDQTYQMNTSTSQNAANTFIPKIWLDEVLVSREKELHAVNFFRRINHTGKAGDTLIIPFISNLAANVMSEGKAVTVQTIAEGVTSITLNKWYETSFLIDDFLRIQSEYNLRSYYTEKAMYAQNLQMENDLWAVFTTALTTTPYYVYGVDGKTQVVGTATADLCDLTDVGIRRMKQTLRENNVPTKDLALFIPPSQENALMGIDKFTLFQHIGRTDELTDGVFGTIYGLDVIVSNNMPTVGSGKVAIMAHREAACTATQLAPRVQADYKLEYLSNLVVIDQIYGVKGLRVGVNDTTGSNNRLSHAVMAFVA